MEDKHPSLHALLFLLTLLVVVVGVVMWVNHTQAEPAAPDVGVVVISP